MSDRKEVNPQIFQSKYFRMFFQALLNKQLEIDVTFISFSKINWNIESLKKTLFRNVSSSNIFIIKTTREELL